MDSPQFNRFIQNTYLLNSQWPGSNLAPLTSRCDGGCRSRNRTPSIDLR